MTTPTDGQIIAARGHAITLINGERPTVRLSMENLLLIEERYGSLGEFQDRLSGWTDGDSHRRPIFTEMVDAMAVCMPTPDLRDRLALARVMAPERLTEYLEAVVAALGEAVATGAQDGPGNAPVPAPMETRGLPPMPDSAYPPGATPLVAGGIPAPWIPAPSPGPSSTTPPPSYSDGPMPSSGG